MPIQDFTKAEIEEMVSKGIDPRYATIVQPPQQQVQQTPGILGTIGAHTKANAGGLIGSAASALTLAAPAASAGAGLGAELGLLGGPLAPITVPVGTALGGIGGGVAAIMGGNYVGQKIQNSVQSDKTNAAQLAALQAADEANPVTGKIVDLTEGALASGGMFSPSTTLKAGKGLIGMIGKKAIEDSEKKALRDVAGQMLLNPAIATATSVAQGQGLPSVRELGELAASGALFAKSWSHGRFGEPKAEVTTKTGGETTTKKEEPLGDITTAFTKRDEAGNYTIGNKSIKSLFLKQFAEPTKKIEDPIAKAEAQTRNELLRNLHPDDMRQQLHLAAMNDKAKSIVGAEDLDAGLHNAENTDDVRLPWQEPLPEVNNSSRPAKTSDILMESKLTTPEASIQSTITPESHAATRPTPAPVSANAQDFLKAKIEDLAQDGIGSKVTESPVLPKVNPVVEEAKAREREQRQDNTQPKSQAELIAEQFEQKGNVNAQPSDPTRPKYIGLQKGGGNIPDTDYYNLVRPITGKFGEIIHAAGSTVSEHTLRKYGIDFDEKGIPTVGVGGGKIGIPIALQSHIRSGAATTGSILQHLADFPNHPYAPLAKALLNMSDTKSLGVRWNHDDRLDTNQLLNEKGEIVRSHYDPSDDQVNIGTHSSADARVVLEEAVHGMTVHKFPNFKGQGALHLAELEEYLKNGKNEHAKGIIKAYIDTAKALGIHDKLFGKDGVAGNPDEAINRLQGVGHATAYAMGNIDEFIAQAIKDHEFQERLANIRVDGGKSILTRLKEALGRLIGLGKDNLSMLDTVFKHSEGVINSNRDGSEGSGVKGSLPKQQRSNKFLVNGAELVKDPTKLGLHPNSSGAYNGTQLLGTLMNKLSPMEQEIYKSQGIEQYFSGKIISQADAVKWMEEHSPKAETHTYGMEGKVSEAKREYDRMTHEWYETLDGGSSAAVMSANALMRQGNEQAAYNKIAQLGTKNYERAKEYIELAKQVHNEPRDTSPRATSHYSSVSALDTTQPMPEWTTSKSGKNVQRVDVVIPRKEYDPNDPNVVSDAGRIDYTDKGKVLESVKWSPDNLHENLPNTLGWAMIQYKTGPKGEKIAVIAEAQSRWGQEAREQKANVTKRLQKSQTELQEELAKNIYGNEHIIQRLKDQIRLDEELLNKGVPKDHPLLHDYNRLILKAAIDQARKEGATHIMVSDAETAMMTERHDVQAAQNKGYRTSEAIKGKTIQSNGENVQLTGDVTVYPEHQKRYGVRLEGRGEIQVSPDYLPEIYQLIKDNPLKTKVEQEPGMRLNYDAILPKIAEELTGSKGEKVSLGEHKNAVELDKNQNDYIENPRNRPRSNLIFRNPDGTPKTDVSGRIYDLSSIPDREPMLYGKRYAMPKDTNYPDDLPPEVPKTPLVNRLFSKLQSTVSAVESKYPVVAQGLRNYFENRSTLAALKNTAIEDLKGYSAKELAHVRDLHNEAYNTGKEPVFKNEREKAISNILSRYYYDEIGQTRRDFGVKIDGREVGMNKWYVPQQMSSEMVKMFTDSKNEEVIRYYKNLWAKYTARESKGAISYDTALENINQFISALGGKNSHYKSVNFGAIRKAAGYGLPEGMRENDVIKSLDRYGERAASDLSMYKHLESDPEVRNALKLNEPITDKRPSSVGLEADPSQNKNVKDAMRWVTGNFSNVVHPAFSATIRAVNNGIMGFPTGLRDLMSVPANMLPYLRIGDLPTVLKGLADFRSSQRDSLRTGATVPTIDRIRFNDMNGATDSFTSAAQKVGDMLRKYQGREAMENLSRDITFSIGKHLAQSRIQQAANGDKGAVSWLKKFGTLVPDNVGELTGKERDDAINQIAKNFVVRNQGSYDARGLPTGMVDTHMAPFLSLQKWSVEKANTLFEDVYKPFVTGENRMPLLTYTLGAVLTGEAIQEINKLLNNRKGQDPEVMEALDSGNAHQVASSIATIMQLGSFGGILGDAMKFASDISNGKAPRSPVSFPTATAAADFAQRTSNMVGAINSGEEPTAVLGQYAIDLMSHNIQNARMLINHTVRDDKMEDSDKFRDMRVFKQLDKGEQGIIAQTNPYLKLETKEFKKAKTIEEAARLLPDVVKSIIQKADGDVFQMKRELDGLKSNSYQTMPNMQSAPLAFVRYINFLKNTQGEEAANERLTDYLMQNEVNRAKSSMVP